MPLLLILAGLSVLPHPVVDTQWNNMKPMKAAEDYSKLERETSLDLLAEQFQAVLDYDLTRGIAPILAPSSTEVGGEDSGYRAYLDQLGTCDSMGRVIVPAAGAWRRSTSSSRGGGKCCAARPPGSDAAGFQTRAKRKNPVVMELDGDCLPTTFTPGACM